MFKKTNRTGTLRKGILLLALVMTVFTATQGIVKAESAKIVNKANSQSVAEIKARTLTIGDSADQSKRINYEITMTSDKKELVVPLKVDSAGILQVLFTDDTNNIDIAFYSDAACTKTIEYNEHTGFGVIPKGGIYYVKFINSYGDYGAEDTVTLKAGFSCQLYPNAVALANGKWQTAGVTDYTKPVYFKLDVNKTSVVELDFQAENTNSFVTLCNSSKTPITDNMTVASTAGKKAFTIKKGSYYIKVTTNAWWVRLKASTHPVTDNSGNSKNNAATLKLGTNKSGMFLLEDKTSKNEWFKFTLSKSTKVDLVISGNVSAGYIRYELTSDKIKGSLKGYLGDVGNVDKKELVYVENKKLHESLPAGTYFIRLYKDSAKTCGNYFVKVINR